MTTSPGRVEVRTELVRAADGATFELELYPNPDRPSAPVLVCMPAMGTPAAYYAPLAEALSAAGLQVALGELRGQGTSSVRAADGARYGYHEMVTLDYPVLFRAVEAAFPLAPRYLLGHSLGGQLGTLYLGTEPEMAKGAILVATPSCDYRGWSFPKSLGVLGGVHLAVLVAQVVGYFPGKRIGILGDDAGEVIRDLAAQVRTGRYRVPSSSVDFEALLARLPLRVLAVAIDGDDLAPVGGVDRLCDKLRNAEITRWVWPLEGADGRNPHYAWVRRSGPLLERVQSFVYDDGGLRS